LKNESWKKKIQNNGTKGGDHTHFIINEEKLHKPLPHMHGG
jgi:hypothetical protein